MITLDNGLAPNRRQAIIWTNADQIYWRVYAALGGEDLRCLSHAYLARLFCCAIDIKKRRLQSWHPIFDTFNQGIYEEHTQLLTRL